MKTEKEKSIIIKEDVDRMVSGMINEFRKYMKEGNENLTEQQRIIVIGRVVNVSHHIYMVLINQMVKSCELKLKENN